MLNKLNTHLENLGEQLRANIKYDLEFTFDALDFLTTKFRKDYLIANNIKKNLYKKIK